MLMGSRLRLLLAVPLLAACAPSRTEDYNISRSEVLIVAFDRYDIGADTLLVPRGQSWGFRFQNRDQAGYRQMYVNRRDGVVWAVALDDLGYSLSGTIEPRPSIGVPTSCQLSTVYQEFTARPLAPVGRTLSTAGDAMTTAVGQAVGEKLIEAILRTKDQEKTPTVDERDRSQANAQARERL